MRKALIIVDPQVDFAPGGSLPIDRAHEIIPVVNRYITEFNWDARVVTQDWHQADTRAHFVKWPPHCVQYTDGARFIPGLDVPSGMLIFRKGVHPDEDSYSGFDGYDNGQSLVNYLEQAEINHLFVGGLATDYCVFETVMRGLEFGYDVTVLMDACRAVTKRGEADTIKHMAAAGAHFTTLRYFQTMLENLDREDRWKIG